MKKETVVGENSGGRTRGEIKDRKWLRRISAVLISAVLIVSGVLMLNVNVRAAVLGVFSGQENEDDGGTLYGVKIGYIPDGYVAVPEIDRVAFGEYGDPTIRRIGFIPEGTEKYWNEPWAFEVAGYTYDYVPQIRIEIDRRGPGRLNSDPSEYVVKLEEITVNGRQAYRSFPGQGIGVDEEGTLYNNMILLFDDDIVIRLQAFGIDGNEAMKIAGGLDW